MTETRGTNMHEYRWFCPECEKELTKGEDAIECDGEPDECVRSERWPGGTCGYVVCADCRSVAEERRVTEKADKENS